MKRFSHLTKTFEFLRFSQVITPAVFLLLVLLILSPVSLQAKEDYYHNAQPLSPGLILDARDEHYPAAPAFSANWMFELDLPIRQQEVKNVVTLRIDQGSPSWMSSTYSCQVEIQVTYRDQFGGSHTRSGKLSIGHNPAERSSRDRSSYLFEGGHDVSVKVLGITGSPSGLILENHIYINRLYDFDVTAAPEFTSADIEIDAGTGEYPVTWDAVDGAEGYELEWVHVNDYSSLEDPGAVSDLEYNFSTNATRVSLTQPGYRISSVFQRGKVLLRVRALTYADLEHTRVIPGRWSSDNGQRTGRKVSDFLQQQGKAIHITASDVHTGGRMGWQYITNYAEEGKKKEVVTYYDGTMRSHQSATRINSDEGSVIVGETYYDHQGRAAVQALPAPASGSRLAYYEGFNRNQASKPYSRADFDRDSGDPCSLSAGQMNTSCGSSNYYSPANQALALNPAGINRLLPNAHGYPFSQTGYEPDNTGRIRSQGGVGEQHQPGSGHETKYFYGKPAQEELDRMFGSEAGLNSHYQKNVVRDANGSMSVSYLDMQGRVVATSLSGNPLGGLEELESNQPKDGLRVNILDNQPAGTGQTRYVSTYHHLVTTEGPHHFTYFLPEIMLEDESLPAGTCLDCDFELAIDMFDDCNRRLEGIAISSNNPQVGNTLPLRIPVSSLGEACERGNLQISFSAELTAGKYTISRTLSLNRNAHIETLLEKSPEPDEVFDRLYQETVGSIDYSECTPLSCYEKCLESDDIDECIFNCEYVNACEIQQSQLHSDFIPGRRMSGDATQGEREGFAEEFNGGGQLEMGGQYALYDVDEYGNYAYYTSDCADNIFSSPQKLQQVCQYLWQAGMLIDKQGEAIPAGDCTLETFIENFRPEWAEKIAGEFHPERGCLIECNSGQNQENLRYDFLMRNTDTYEQAHARGLLNPLGLLGSSNNLPAAVRSGMDPFFLFEGKGAVMKAQMILNFTTRSFTNPADPTQTFTGNLLEQAAMMVMCSRQEPVSQDIIQSTYNFRHFDQSSPNPCTRDRIWEFFRALYLSEKGKLQAGMENGSCRPEIAQGKARRFPDPFDQFTDVEKQLMESDLKSEEDIAGFVEDAGRLLEEACLQRAQSYADNCLKQLEGCLELSTVGNSCAVWDNTCGQYNRLKNAFVFIINSGCNKDNVTGGSNVPADKLSSLNPELDQYPDFHHAMRAILTSGSDGDFTLACNPNLITFPKVLGHSYPSLTSHKKIDECACEQILRSDKEYRMLVQAGRYPKNDITSAQKYFERTYGTGVDNYRAKVCLCEEAAAGEWTANFSINESGRAKLAASDEFVPLAMTCQTCVDCLQMQQAINEFNAQAWIFKLLSLGRPLTTLENYSRQSLLTTFLNGRFDMDKISWDYEEFQKKCGIIETTDVYCELTPQARELETLLNTVTLNGGLTSRNCEPAVSRGISRWFRQLLKQAGTVTHILENNCAACDQYIYEPQVNNGVLAMHLPGQGCNNLDHCPVTLSLSQADAQAGYRLERLWKTCVPARPNR